MKHEPFTKEEMQELDRRAREHAEYYHNLPGVFDRDKYTITLNGEEIEYCTSQSQVDKAIKSWIQVSDEPLQESDFKVMVEKDYY